MYARTHAAEAGGGSSGTRTEFYPAKAPKRPPLGERLAVVRLLVADPEAAGDLRVRVVHCSAW